MRLKKTGIIIIIIISIVSCSDLIDTPYGKEFNETRKSIGLRIIDADFKTEQIVSIDSKKSPIYRRIKGVPSVLSKINKPIYIGKNIHLNENNGDIIYEEDLFVSGFSKFDDKNETNGDEKLILRYTFDDINYSFNRPSSLGGNIKKNYTKGWEYIYEYPIIWEVTSNQSNKVFHTLKTKMITEKEADSILKSWKLIRLNF